MITTVLLLLQTTKCSGFFAKLCILFTGVSEVPNVLNVFMHSVVFMLHTFTVPSEEALQRGEIKKFANKQKAIRINLKIL